MSKFHKLPVAATPAQARKVRKLFRDENCGVYADGSYTKVKYFLSQKHLSKCENICKEHLPQGSWELYACSEDSYRGRIDVEPYEGTPDAIRIRCR